MERRESADRSPGLFGSPMRLLRRKKEKVAISYQVLGQSGLENGSVVFPGEPISHSWTVRNAAPLHSKEKGKVVKLLFSHGTELCPQVLFLWPVPGKTVAVSPLSLSLSLSGGSN